jgi:hypothetical protein
MKTLVPVCWLVGAAASISAAVAAPPDAHADEPTQASCLKAVAAARELAERLPAGDATRYFAERDLQQAMTEAGNGEFDDCLEWAAQAALEVKEHRHTLAPGESLKVRPAEQ